MLTLSCPSCRTLLDTGTVKTLGYEAIQCKGCGKVCRTTYTEWAHLTPSGKRWFWFRDLLFSAIFFGVIAACIARSEPSPRAITFVLRGSFCLVCLLVIWKFALVKLSLARCPTNASLTTVRKQMPRKFLWLGIAMTASPLLLLTALLTPVAEYSMWPFIASLPTCLVGVFLWQQASLRGIAKTPLG